jgi:hypothetical protein
MNQLEGLTSPPSTPQRPNRLSAEIDHLLASLGQHPTTLRKIIDVIQGRAYTLLLILLSLPFCLPLPLPGLSTALGAVIALIGLRLSLRLEPWLPPRVLDAELKSANVVRVLTASRRVARMLEVLLRPRWSFLVDFVLLHHLYGAMIFISGVLLMLPLPIPFSNLVPALTIIFLAAALLERDGFFIVAGVVMFLLTLAFFGFLFIGGVAAANWLEEWFGGIFDPDEIPPPELPISLPQPTIPDANAEPLDMPVEDP